MRRIVSLLLLLACGGFLIAQQPQQPTLSPILGSVLARSTTGTRGLWMAQNLPQNPTAPPYPPWFSISGEVVNVKEFGAAGDGVTDDTSAIQAALAALSRGGILFMPCGTYKLTSTLTIPIDGVILRGCGSHADSGTKPTTLSFNTLANSAVAIDANGRDGLRFEDFYLEMTAGTGGAGIRVRDGSGIHIENVVMTVSRGTSAYGIQFSDTSGISNAVIASSIRDTIVGGSPGIGIYIGVGSTSIAIESTYVVSASGGAAYKFQSATYSTLSATAADSGTGGSFGYLFDASSDITLIGAGAEANAKGHTQITNNSIGISLIGCRGVGNNTDADVAIGSFVNITATGINYNVTIIGGIDASANAATTDNIKAGAGTLWTNVLGYNTTSFPQGIGGDATWRANYVSLLSGGEIVAGNLTLGGPGGSGAVITAHLSGTGTWDPGNLANGASASTDVTVTGVTTLSSTVTVGFPMRVATIPQVGMQISGYVKTLDTVTVTITNNSGGAVDLDSGTIRADVWQH